MFCKTNKMLKIKERQTKNCEEYFRQLHSNVVYFHAKLSHLRGLIKSSIFFLKQYMYMTSTLSLSTLTSVKIFKYYEDLILM